MIIKFKAKWDQTDFFGSFVTLWLKFGALFDNFNASDVVAKKRLFPGFGEVEPRKENRKHKWWIRYKIKYLKILLQREVSAIRNLCNASRSLKISLCQLTDVFNRSTTQIDDKATHIPEQPTTMMTNASKDHKFRVILNVVERTSTHIHLQLSQLSTRLFIINHHISDCQSLWTVPAV